MCGTEINLELHAGTAGWFFSYSAGINVCSVSALCKVLRRPSGSSSAAHILSQAEQIHPWPGIDFLKTLYAQRNPTWIKYVGLWGNNCTCFLPPKNQLLSVYVKHNGTKPRVIR